MLSGVGSLCLRTRRDDPDDDFIYPAPFVNFSITSDIQSKEAKGWVAGQLQTLATAVASSSYTLTLESEYVDWATLAWAFDEVPTTSTNTLIPYTKVAIANSSGVVSDADITSGMKMLAFVSSRGAWGEPGPIPESSVTVASGTITLGATYANAPISYHYEKLAASVETIGLATGAETYGKMSFSGVGFGPAFPKGIIIVIPEVTRKSSPSLETADVPRLTVEYGISIPSGSEKPFRFYNLSTIPTS